MAKSFAKLFSTFFYVGYSPAAPGTCASIVSIPLILFCARSDMLYTGVLLVCLFVGRWSAYVIARAVRREDPSEVVIDEVCGMLITFLFIPLTSFYIVLGFVLFRFFDITKPWLVRKAENVPHGYGIMLDDIVAGFFSNIIMQLLVLIF